MACHHDFVDPFQTSTKMAIGGAGTNRAPPRHLDRPNLILSESLVSVWKSSLCPIIYQVCQANSRRCQSRYEQHELAGMQIRHRGPGRASAVLPWQQHEMLALCPLALRLSSLSSRDSHWNALPSEAGNTLQVERTEFERRTRTTWYLPRAKRLATATPIPLPAPSIRATILLLLTGRFDIDSCLDKMKPLDVRMFLDFARSDPEK